MTSLSINKQALVVAGLLCALSLGETVARAQTVNKWVDDEGVTHYSDQKPAGAVGTVREMEIPEASVTGFDSQDVNERLNKALQQMEQDRKAREQEAEATQQARDVEQALEREPIVAEEKKKKKDRDRSYDGPYPKPLPGPFPEKYPRLPKYPKPAGSSNPANQSN